MEVHPPHESIHTWRDFFVHIAVITIGLVIALALENLAGWIHEKHLVHTAESNLRSELQANRSTLTNDANFVSAAQKQAESNLAILSAYKSTHHPGGELKFYWEWNGPASAAWDTARNTGAVALMDYGLAQQYSDAYTQQSLVTAAAAVYIRDIYRSAAPLEGGRRLMDLQPAEVDSMISNVQQTMADLNFLRDLSENLARDYQHVPTK